MTIKMTLETIMYLICVAIWTGLFSWVFYTLGKQAEEKKHLEDEIYNENELLKEMLGIEEF